MPAVEPKRATHDAAPCREREAADLLAAIRSASKQMEQTLRAVDSSVERLWRTSRSDGG
jgi:hypothetical protein